MKQNSQVFPTQRQEEKKIMRMIKQNKQTNKQAHHILSFSAQSNLQNVTRPSTCIYRNNYTQCKFRLKCEEQHKRTNTQIEYR
jgi:hypothetical protein